MDILKTGPGQTNKNRQQTPHNPQEIMIKPIKTISTFLALSTLYFLFWNGGFLLCSALFSSAVTEPDISPTLSLTTIFLSSALNTAVLMITIANARWSGIRLIGVLTLQIFIIQFFMSQIEALWFNNALEVPVNLIYSSLLGGFLTAALFSIVSVRIMGRFKCDKEAEHGYEKRPWKEVLLRFALLCILVYPALYFLAGYFIAWQFEVLRIHYTDSAALYSFWTVMAENMHNGTWLWQIFRGMIWIAVAWPVIYMIRGGFPRSAVIVGLLFATLMVSQLLIPNPYMPGMVRLAHGIETSLSNFIWGFIVIWLLTPRSFSN